MRPGIRIFGLCGTAFLLATLPVSGFEVEKPLPRVVLALEGATDGMNAAYYAALERGLYREAGLDVRIVTRNGTSDAVKAVTEGGADLGTADTAAVLALRARGAAVCVVAAVTEKAPYCVFSLSGAKITVPKDLSGKKVAYARFGDPGILFPLFLQAVGLYPEDVTLVPVEPGQRLPSAVLGKVDAFLGTLQERPYMEALRPQGGLSVMLWADHGFDLCSACIYAGETWAAEHPALVTSFLEASFRGWAWTLDHPEEAAQALSRYRLADVRAVTAEIAAVKPLLLTEAARTDGMGAIPFRRAQATLESMGRDRGVALGTAAAGAFPAGFLPDPPVLLGVPEESAAGTGKEEGKAAPGAPQGAAPGASSAASTSKKDGAK